MRITMTGTADIQAKDERGKPFMKALHTGQGYDVSDEDGERLVGAGLAAEGDVTVEKSVKGPPEDKSVGVGDAGVADKDRAGFRGPPDGNDTTRGPVRLLNDDGSGDCGTCGKHFKDLERHEERMSH